MPKNKPLKVLYFIPSRHTIYAGRTIFHGYQNAFLDMGYDFQSVSAEDDIENVFAEFAPDILMMSLDSFSLKYLDPKLISRYKKKGLKVFVNTPFWHTPFSKTRINEISSLAENKEHINLIKSRDFGDVYYNVCEPGDPRMTGFEEVTGYKLYTIPLAADKIALNGILVEKFKADISFIGTYLPSKRKYFEEYVFPLRQKFNLKIYGQDWTVSDRFLGWIQRAGQYFNIPFLRSFRKPKLELTDEANIYKSSVISINVHEEHQKKIGRDCNERTFKIPFCGGFEITDDVACIRKYFKEGEEIIIAKDEQDWLDKIEYFIKNPDRRLPIIKAGRERILRDHTYHNRARQILDIFYSL